MSTAGISLKVRNLSKNWGATKVLTDVDFEIHAGGFLTLLGPSGCGKSTALRLISGLDSVTDGQILLDGQDMTNTPAADRNIGMVFQNYALFPHMSVADNITYGLNVRKISKPKQVASLARVSELMALGSLLSRKPAQLSGGQQQRVALARVLVSERPLVLMDEPLSNLDAKLRVEIRGEIRALNKKLGITVLYVTHDQSEALTMSDIVVLMNAGKVVQVGSPQDLYDRPANMFAASFIGTPPMNLLPSRDVLCPENISALAALIPSDVIFGVRPECLTLNPLSNEFKIKARVESIEYEGKAFLVHLVTSSGTKFIAAHAGEGVPTEGSEVSVGWSANSVHVFSKKDGKRRDFTL